MDTIENPRRMRRPLMGGLLAAALLAGAAPAAFAQSWVDLLDPAVVEAALAEGELTLYSAQSQAVVENTVAAFTEAFPGIEVNFLRAASGVMINRYFSEVDAGVFEADVAHSSALALFTERPELWQELTVELLPTLAEWPEEEIHGIYLNSGQGTQAIVYNTQLIPEDEAPRTWEDLLDPKYRGRGMMVDPRSSNTYMGWVNLMYEHYGPEFVEAIRDQEFVLVEGGTQGVQPVAAGAFLVTFPPSYAHIQPLYDQGAPIGYFYPPEHSDVPAIGPLHSWGLPARSPHPNAARVFMTWFLTEEGQIANCGGIAASVRLPDYDGCPRPFSGYVPGDQPIEPERLAELLRLLDLQ